MNKLRAFRIACEAGAVALWAVCTLLVLVLAEGRA
jgi:hypothetical protein